MPVHMESRNHVERVLRTSLPPSISFFEEHQPSPVLVNDAAHPQGPLKIHHVAFLIFTFVRSAHDTLAIDKAPILMTMLEDITWDFTSQLSASKLESPVATGSFSEVYRCTVESSIIGKTEVAVKVFKVDPRRDVAKLKKAMVRELTVWLKLKDPTIVPLLGTAQVKSPLRALVCQWMPSGTLVEYLDKQATNITTSARIKLVEGIAEGLDYLHSENVIHGDLHPGNVFIDKLGNPRLADFGLATIAENLDSQWSTTTAAYDFNPRWRAPEGVGIDGNPERSTFKSDIYSFGGITFYVISGDVPWKDMKSNRICIKLSLKLTPLRPHLIFDDHWNFIQKCLSWNPEDRPEASIVLNWVQVIAEYPRDAIGDFTSQVSDKLRSPIPSTKFIDVSLSLLWGKQRSQ